jgi:hypothetical protein
LRYFSVDLRTTRFRKASDFYTLSALIGKYEQEGLVLTDQSRNNIAWQLLKDFSSQVDEVAELQKHARSIGDEFELYRNYLLTVKRGTDEIAHRRQREALLDRLLRTLFEKKDRSRAFSETQRRMIWHSAGERRCSYPGCQTLLTWDDFTVDHRKPHSKGGLTELKNASLMCRRHNSMKGNRAMPLSSSRATRAARTLA